MSSESKPNPPQKPSGPAPTGNPGTKGNKPSTNPPTGNPGTRGSKGK